VITFPLLRQILSFLKVGVIRDPLAIGIAAQLFSTPLSIYYFEIFSLIAPLANLIIVPISGILTAGGLFLFFISLLSQNLVLWISGGYILFTKLLIYSASFFSNLPFWGFEMKGLSLFHVSMIYFFLTLPLALLSFRFYSRRAQIGTQKF